MHEQRVASNTLAGRLTLLGLAIALVSGCANAPSIVTYDPRTATDEEVATVVAQFEDLARRERHRIRTSRLIRGSVLLAIGAALEGALLALGEQDCFGDPDSGNNCVAQVALAIGVAGGLLGSSLSTLVVPTQGELDLEGFVASEARTPDEQRAKLLHAYRLFSRPSLEGGGVIHQMGSGLLIGAGIAFVTVPSLLPDDDGKGLVIPGAVMIGLGAFWGALATVLREPTVYDLTWGAGASRDGFQLSFSGRF